MEISTPVTPSVNTMFVAGHSWLLKYTSIAATRPQETARKPHTIEWRAALWQRLELAQAHPASWVRAGRSS